MKKIKWILLTCMAVVLILTSCQKDEEKTPDIMNMSVGDHDGTTTEIALGGVAVVEFDAVSNSGERLAYYHIEMHDHPESGLIEDEYRIIDEDFEEDFVGLMNAHVHHHVTIPVDAKLGEYHVVVTVVDESGYSADTENDDFHIQVIEN